MERKELFKRIYANHNEPCIVSLAGNLMKKCNLTTQNEASDLCKLTFWLYIYGYIQEVEEIYEITTDVPFPGKAVFNVWTYLLEICIVGQLSRQIFDSFIMNPENVCSYEEHRILYIAQ